MYSSEYMFSLYVGCLSTALCPYLSTPGFYKHLEVTVNTIYRVTDANQKLLLTLDLFLTSRMRKRGNPGMRLSLARLRRRPEARTGTRRRARKRRSPRT